MKISARGLAFIKGFEYFVPYLYDDLVPPKKARGRLVYTEWKGGPLTGTLTCGYGHTAAARYPLDMKPGLRLTEPEACRILDVDLDEAEETVNRLVKVPLTQGQFDALTSLVFNIGGGNFRKSSLLARLNRGDYDGARAAFDLYTRSKGRVLPGLVRRRDGEQVLWDSNGHAPDIPAEPVHHSADVDRPAPPKTMAVSKEGNAAVGIGIGGASAIASEVNEAAGQAAQLKQNAEDLGVFDILTVLAAKPVFWIAAATVVAVIFMWFWRRRRLYEDFE